MCRIYRINMNNSFFYICISLLLFALSGCTSHNEVVAPPEQTTPPYVSILALPTAIEGKPNVEYTFSVLQKNIPDNALFRWFVDPQYPVELQTSQSFHYIFSEDGFYFITLEVVDKEISKIFATAKLKVNIRSTLPKLREIRINSGTFEMGKQTEFSENPVRVVSISTPFHITETEITQKQWSDIYGHNPSWFKGDNLPVETVSWYEALEFCNSLSIRSGLEPCYTFLSDDSVQCDFLRNGYRLPTEMEWEYAARAGAKWDTHNGNISSTIDGCLPLDPALDKLAWYCGNAEFTTHEVAEKQPNQWGLYDMLGNVQEWCWDWYDAYYYAESPLTDARGPSTGTHKSCRGGSWYNQVFLSRLSARLFYRPSNRTNIIGFRIVRKAE